MPREAPEPPLFLPPGNAFAVLLDESRLSQLIEALSGRTDLRMLFVVTDARESFKELSGELEDALGPQNPGLQIVQLYRDYLENFMINREPTGHARPGQGSGPSAVRGGGQP
ncbi:MAG: hypothetical protein KFB96_15840 [Thiocapsa sp.]|uniref:hypothetical protein n=1 Tax=Thiocapsa sp. TaxID=2024551 RepID=UPI001BCBCFFC|nr:hypothetical protein [Thiocapsa sp.]QVL47189.1 MAG: hypothetical protein KFB96_15840 [Thiocapsa sp.]